jgi:hypothetical protein
MMPNEENKCIRQKTYFAKELVGSRTQREYVAAIDELSRRALLSS